MDNRIDGYHQTKLTTTSATGARPEKENEAMVSKQTRILTWKVSLKPGENKKIRPG